MAINSYGGDYRPIPSWQQPGAVPSDQDQSPRFDPILFRLLLSKLAPNQDDQATSAYLPNILRGIMASIGGSRANDDPHGWFPDSQLEPVTGSSSMHRMRRQSVYDR